MVRNEAPARAKAAGERQLPNDLSLPRQSSTLLKGTAGSVRKRSTSSLRVSRRSSRLWPVRRGGRPRRRLPSLAVRGGQPGLGVMKGQTLGDDGVVASSDQIDQGGLQRCVPVPGQMGGMAGAPQQAPHPVRPVLLLDLDQGLEFAQMVSVA